ncbi:MAG: condensation protein [Sphingobacteriales bacterium]|nr:MAG: condensation protein [Sphingobacteriales bacterium]
MTKKQNRTLGAFEKTFWLLDQIDSKDFALAAEVEGKETAEVWQSAIRQVQRRHPNLSVRIVMDGLQRAAIEHVDSVEIPLRIMDVDKNFKWEQEVENELSTRFDTDKGPLLRVVIIQKPEDTVVVLVANHALADGSSLNFLFRDILNAATGQELEILAPQRSNDQTLGLPDDLPGKTESPAYGFKKIEPVYPKVESLRFSAENTLGILERSRLEQTTVHGAICAAAVIAGRKLRGEWEGKKLELISPICTRRALDLDDNFGLNITTHPVYFEPGPNPSFWDLARVAKWGLAGTDTVEHVQNYIGFFRKLAFNNADIQQIIDVLKEAFNHDIMVTNLVKVKYDTDFGKLKLRSVYGPMVRSGKGKEQTIGAISTNGHLSLTNTSDNPIPGLLMEMEGLLLRECAGRAGSIA